MRQNLDKNQSLDRQINSFNIEITFQRIPQESPKDFPKNSPKESQKIPQKFETNFQKKKIPNNPHKIFKKKSQNFENIQFPSSHIKAKNPFRACCINFLFFLKLQLCFSQSVHVMYVTNKDTSPHV